ADPTAAFINIRSSLRPNGRLAFVCRRALKENPLDILPLRCGLSLVGLRASAPAVAIGTTAAGRSWRQQVQHSPRVQVVARAGRACGSRRQPTEREHPRLPLTPT